MASTKISIVVLSYNRLDLLRQILASLCSITYRPMEIIVVDNNSEEPIGRIIKAAFPDITVLQMEENLGTGGRNRGIAAAEGDIIITLDDDVTGIDDNAVKTLIRLFENASAGAICFKVLNAETGGISNWCHHYPPEHFADISFRTNEITEGAVAFRKSALERSGLYPESFFISHEGPDLAYRIMNEGFDVVYSPEIVVRHHHSQLGRTGWRRHYYDTRNLFWLAARNYPLAYGIKRLSIGLGALFLYSVRDGHLRYWMKGVADGVLGLREAFRERRPPQARTMEIVREIEKNRPGYIHLLRQRLAQREVRI